MLEKVWRLLISRKLAVWLLLAMVAVLTLSSLLPSKITYTERQWTLLKQEKPMVAELAEAFNTPAIVRNPVFVLISAFLFISTCACTAQRVRLKLRGKRAAALDLENAFSFEAGRTAHLPVEKLAERLEKSLRRGRWRLRVSRPEEEPEGGVVINAEKGGEPGFWGSVLFHIGLILAFLAAPVTLMSVARAQVWLVEGQEVPLREASYMQAGSSEMLPATTLKVEGLEGKFFEGRYDLDFRGTLVFGDGTRLDMAVNEPVNYRGFQFTLHQFGHAPEVLLRKPEGETMSRFLLARDPFQGDAYDLPESRYKLFALLFPDFVQYPDGNIGSRTRELDNPVLMLQLRDPELDPRRGGTVAKTLLKPGAEKFSDLGPYEVALGEIRNWTGLVVVRESGVSVVFIGMLIGVPGLLLRFLSNERVLRYRLEPAAAGGGTKIQLRGYSRYYPALLEREVTERVRRLQGVGKGGGKWMDGEGRGEA